MKLLANLFIFAILAVNFSQERKLSHKIYFHKCLHSIHNWVKIANSECLAGGKTLQQNRGLVNQKANEFLVKLKFLKESASSKILKTTAQLTSAAEDTKKPSYIFKCIERISKKYREKIDESFLKMVDDFNFLHKIALQNLETYNRIVIEIKNSLPRKNIEAKQDLSTCGDAQCLSKKTDGFKQDIWTLKTRAKHTSSKGENIFRDFSKNLQTFLDSFSEESNMIQKNADEALNKCYGRK